MTASLELGTRRRSNPARTAAALRRIARSTNRLASHVANVLGIAGIPISPVGSNPVKSW